MEDLSNNEAIVTRWGNGLANGMVGLEGGVAHIVQIITIEGDQIVALEEYIAPEDANPPT